MLDISTTYSASDVFGANRGATHNTGPSPRVFHPALCGRRLGGGLQIAHLLFEQMQSTSVLTRASGHLRQRRTLTANSLSASVWSMALMSPAVFHPDFSIGSGGKARGFARVRGWTSISGIKALAWVSQFRRNVSYCNAPFQRGESNTNSLSSVGTIYIKPVLPC